MQLLNLFYRESAFRVMFGGGRVRREEREKKIL